MGATQLRFLAMASRSGVTVLGYDDHAAGTLTMADRKMRITAVALRPRITVAPGTGVEKVRRLVHGAHEVCLIATSVSSSVTVEPEVVTGA